MRVNHKTFVLVADGRKMLLFRNKGDAFKPDLEIVDMREQDNPPDRMQSSDAPGRAFASVGSGRSAMEETDFHQLEADRFAADTAHGLRSLALRNEFEHLVVVAPPRTLGELRKHYHKEVEARLVKEIPKDLTGHPVARIEQVLVANGD